MRSHLFIRHGTLTGLVLALAAPIMAAGTVDKPTVDAQENPPVTLKGGGVESSRNAVLTVLPWWLPPAQIEEKIWPYLKDKAGGDVVVPDYPANDVLGWSKQRFASQPTGKMLYRVLFEHLLIAHKLLNEASLAKTPVGITQQKRRAMQLADKAALYAGVSLKDSWLEARIYEAFLLPNLDAASAEGWEMLSQDSIIEGVGAIYERTGETEKKIAAFKLLIKVATTRNRADSARARLAVAYAAQGDYERAIAYLEGITDSGIVGSKSLIPEYRKRQAEKERRAKEQAAKVQP